MNTEKWRRAAVPSTNGHATARAIAGFYAGMLDNAPHPVLSAELRREATTTHSDGHDLVLGRTTRFGLGFALHLPERPIGTSPAAFGHFGYGGSLGFADPDADVAFAYLINRPGDRWQNPRPLRLLEALRGCL
jgi:CubicO group peptidase (beta-lactamase class C family)